MNTTNEAAFIAQKMMERLPQGDIDGDTTLAVKAIAVLIAGFVQSYTTELEGQESVASLIHATTLNVLRTEHAEHSNIAHFLEQVSKAKQGAEK